MLVVKHSDPISISLLVMSLLRSSIEIWCLKYPHKSSGEGNGNPLQYSCLENPMDRGAWQAVVHRVTESLTRLK